MLSAVRTFLYNFDIKALNIGLTEIPLIRGEKIYTARNVRLKLKRWNHVQSDFGKKKCNFKIEKQQQKTWLLSYKCTQGIRLRVLQGKILHSIYPTNILLS